MNPSLQPVVGIYSVFSSDVKMLQDLKSQLSLPIIETPPTELPAGQFCVVLEEDNSLALHFTGRGVPGSIKVDFLKGSAAHRRQFGGGKGQLIAKAVGIKKSFRPNVLDLTAGLGQDAFVLAGLGCKLTMIERVDIVYQLLDDGLQRALMNGDIELREIVSTMQLKNCNAIDYLKSLLNDNVKADVIYLDPMFPEREKKAKVKKSMSAFHSLVGSDDDAGELLQLALMCANYRIVVKRPRKAMSIAEQYPQLNLPKAGLVLEGKSSRYDIYPLAKLPD